jgi:ketosteroid isomerase-like protein
MTIANIEDFQALDPFFTIIGQGLDGLVDGEHFFDKLAEDAVTEFVVTVPGFPRRIEGRAALAELYRPYGDGIVLEHADELFVHHDREASVVVLEYAVHGHTVVGGKPYSNRFVSIITIQDRKITHWRDYLDSFTAVQVLSTVD